MRFNNISNEIKKGIVEEGIVRYEKSIYELIIKLGIEPNDFDPETFDAEEEGHPPHVLPERVELEGLLSIWAMLQAELAAVSD